MKPYIVIPFILLILPLQVLAQSTQDQILPEVVVTPPKVKPHALSVEGKTAAVNNVVIDRDIIENSMAKNLTELLVEQGIAAEAAPTDYDENVVLLRGFATEHLNSEVNGTLLILIDGRRSGVASARQIALQNVERIEIIRGAEMYKYAMSSPGGIINIITKRGGSGAFAGSVQFGGGSYDAWKAGASIGGQVNNFDYSIGYTHSAVGGDYKDGNGKKVYSTKTDGTDNVFVNLGYTVDGNHRIGLDTYYYDVDRAYRPAYIDDEGDPIPPGYTNRKSQIYSVNYEGKSGDKRFSWYAGVNFSKDAYENYSGQKYPREQEVETRQARAELTYHGANFDVSGGLDFVKYDIENSGASNSYYYANTDWPIVLHPTSSSRIFGVYLVGTLRFMNDRLNITGGLRHENSSAKDKAVGDEDWNSYSYFQGLSRDQFPDKRSFNHLSPSLGISYLPVEWLKLRADFTQAWRAPTGRQLFASRRTEGYGAGGDPRLVPELTNAYEVGFDFAADHANLSATYFFDDIKNYIYLNYYTNPSNTSATGGRVMRNAEKRYQAGIEILTSVNLAGLMGYEAFALRPFVNLTHMTKREEILKRGAPYLEGRWWPIVRMPDTVMNYGIAFTHYGWNFNANLNFSYSGLRVPGRANATPTGDYHDQEFGKINVANLSLTKRLWQFPDKSNIDLKININNLFDKVYSYRDRVGTGANDTYPHQGRNYYATLMYNF
ncbi:MAG: TonB-dependent receptor [Burkholderiales bacterium]|jgi:outer membrane receptor protein involved in Fe transport|nr:TonB-dependent receptor [Burkholderiales bacterium]